MCLTHTWALCEWFLVTKIQQFHTPALIFAASPGTNFTAPFWIFGFVFFEEFKAPQISQEWGIRISGNARGPEQTPLPASLCSFPRKTNLCCDPSPNSSTSVPNPSKNKSKLIQNQVQIHPQVLPGPAPSSWTRIFYRCQTQEFLECTLLKFPWIWGGFNLTEIKFKPSQIQENQRNKV